MKNILKYLKAAVVLVAIISGASISYGQFSVTSSQTAAQLASKLVGAGVTVTNPTLVCNSLANGVFTSTATPVTFSNGVVLSTGKVTDIGNAASLLASTSFISSSTTDNCTLEFDF